jgi:hypothetical protein
MKDKKEAAGSSLGQHDCVGVNFGSFVVAVELHQAIRTDQSGQQLRVGEKFGGLLILAGLLGRLEGLGESAVPTQGSGNGLQPVCGSAGIAAGSEADACRIAQHIAAELDHPDRGDRSGMRRAVNRPPTREAPQYDS